MARSIAYWKGVMLGAMGMESSVSGVTSTSKTAEWNLWADVWSFCMNVLDGFMDNFRADVAAIIAAQKPHTLQWYAEKAKLFQYGVALPADSDVYAVVPAVDPSVYVVNYAAAVEQTNNVRIKVATSTGSVLGPVGGPQLTAFTAYMGQVKDAGVRLLITSGNADSLQLGITIYYDPLVLDADGKRLDGTADTPVKDAINAFLDNLPFNGLFVKNRLVAAIEAIDGVRIATPGVVQANYGATPYVPIVTEYVPDGGYMVLDSGYFDGAVAYVAHGVI